MPQTRAWAECYDVLSTLSKLGCWRCVYLLKSASNSGVLRITPESISTQIPQMLIAAKNPLQFSKEWCLKNDHLGEYMFLA